MPWARWTRSYARDASPDATPWHRPPQTKASDASQLYPISPKILRWNHVLEDA